jgi:hypothetical protein
VRFFVFLLWYWHFGIVSYSDFGFCVWSYFPMNQDVCWYRVFGSKVDAPDLSKLRAVYRLAADEHGWYQVHFPLLWGEIELNRWLPKKDRIRTELNTWAAWVEAHGEGKLDWLMQRIIATEQLGFIAADGNLLVAEEGA